VARASWPAADEALLAQETVTCVVQVNGKVRGKLDVPPGIGDDELHELAMTEPAGTRALNGLEISRVIVRAPKLVNIVAR
jgi:leucyl-tRNA synthetase